MASEATSPEVTNWVDLYKSRNLDIEELHVLNNKEFEIKPNGGNFNAHGTMSIAKLKEGGNWVYVWGYSTQLNMKKRLDAGNYVQQFGFTRGQDVEYPDSGFLNFWCNYEYSSTCKDGF